MSGTISGSPVPTPAPQSQGAGQIPTGQDNTGKSEDQIAAQSGATAELDVWANITTESKNRISDTLTRSAKNKNAATQGPSNKAEALKNVEPNKPSLDANSFSMTNGKNVLARTGNSHYEGGTKRYQPADAKQISHLLENLGGSSQAKSLSASDHYRLAGDDGVTNKVFDENSAAASPAAEPAPSSNLSTGAQTYLSGSIAAAMLELQMEQFDANRYAQVSTIHQMTVQGFMALDLQQNVYVQTLENAKQTLKSAEISSIGKMLGGGLSVTGSLGGMISEASETGVSQHKNMRAQFFSTLGSSGDKGVESGFNIWSSKEKAQAEKGQALTSMWQSAMSAMLKVLEQASSNVASITSAQQALMQQASENLKNMGPNLR